MSTPHRVSKPFLIGVAGGTASGKSTVCEKIMAKLGQDCQRRVALIKQDSFYRELTPEELVLAQKGCYNFDHPDAIDEAAMVKALEDMLESKPVRLPIHDYQDNKPKEDEFYTVESADVLLFEGVLIFYFPKVREMFHMKLFVDTDSDTRLSRRVVRDVRDRGRSLEIVLNQYDQYVKPAFEEFCLPTKKYADMIIPRGAENQDEFRVHYNLINFLFEHDPLTEHDNDFVNLSRNWPHKPQRDLSAFSLLADRVFQEQRSRASDPGLSSKRFVQVTFQTS